MWPVLTVGGGGLLGSAALLAHAAGVSPWLAHAATQGRALPQEVTVASPRPVFMQQGAVLSGTRMVWTATNGQGAAGSEADRIYCYDVQSRRLTTPVRSHFGASGFIGDYALAGDKLAYVDTAAGPGGIFSWRVSIANLRTHHEDLVASPDPGASSTIPPQIAYDGTHLLMLETINVNATEHESIAVLLNPDHRARQVLQRVRGVTMSDPALARTAALWTVQNYTRGQMSSQLTGYDFSRRSLQSLPVYGVMQVAAGGDTVVWWKGEMGGRGHIDLYSLSQHRVLATNLAHNPLAIFPAVNGRMVSWTYSDGSRVQLYDLNRRRVVYSAPHLPGRYYGASALDSQAASWVYTVGPASPSGKAPLHGYVVFHRL